MIQAPSRYARIIRVIVPLAALSGLVYLFLITFIPDHYEAASASISSSASSLRSSLTKGGEAVRSGYQEVANKKAALLNIDFLGKTEHDGDDGARAIQRTRAQKEFDIKGGTDDQKRTGYHHHHHHSSKQQIQQKQAGSGEAEDPNGAVDGQAKKVELNTNNIYNEPTAETDEPIYEVEKANGVLVVFTSEEQIQDARQTVRDMEDRFNRGRNYPWVILSALPLTERSKLLTAQLTKGTMTFGTVPRAHYRMPKSIDVGKSMAKDRDLIFAGVNINRTAISERHRWRYLAGFLARHELLDGYEFFWRVDPGLEIFCDIEDDPMLAMKKNGQKFAWSMSTTEHKDGVPSAWTFVDTFKKTHADVLPQHNSEFFLTKETGDEFTTCTFGVQNSIGRVDFFRSPEYLALFDAIENEGLIYYEKFTDAIVATLGISLLLPKSQILHLGGMGWATVSQEWSYCPHSSELNAKCHCNPNPAIKPAHLSCNSFWLGKTKSPRKHERLECDKEGKCVLYIDVTDEPVDQVGKGMDQR
ncbi:alpha 1,2-mannosyltransferase 2.4.1 [Podila epicladia]|nr:alpha 1,2-mannosyltransferase 2.4.1 [Podila epicladia]